MKSESIQELAKALLAAQAEFSAVPKGSDNPFYKSKYAALPDVVKHAGPVLSKHGLAVSQFVDNVNGEDALTTYLIHSSGEWISHSMLLHLVKNDPQAQGSAITYARRYSYMACLGLVADEDDDGNAASKPSNFSRPAASFEPTGELPEEVAKIIEAAKLEPGNGFLTSLAEQYMQRGSLSDKQLQAGFRQALKVLSNSAWEPKPGEEPFE